MRATPNPIARSGPRQVLDDARFASRMEPLPNGCIQWIGRIRSDGYGDFPCGGRPGKHVLAHRWAYERIFGPVDLDLELDHLCRNRACVSVLCLEPVTPAENRRRTTGYPTRHVHKTHCPKGHPYAGSNFISAEKKCRICKYARIKAWHERYLREHGHPYGRDYRRRAAGGGR